METPAAVVRFWDASCFAPTIPYSPPMMHWGVSGACKECSSDVKCYSSEGSPGPCRVQHVHVPVNVLISHWEEIRLTAWRNWAFIKKQAFERWAPCINPLPFTLPDRFQPAHESSMTSQMTAIIIWVCLRVCVCSEPVSAAALKLSPYKLLN